MPNLQEQLDIAAQSKSSMRKVREKYGLPHSL